MKRWLLIAGRLGIAVIFLYAGIAKVREPWLQFAVSIESFKIVPETWLEPIARILPWCEIALGIALLTGILSRWFSLILFDRSIQRFQHSIDGFAKRM